MDRLEAMSLLIDTVDAGSFSAAARRRDMPAATLTRKIDQLERHLGAGLLLRSTRRLTLTDAGQRYTAKARAILSQIRETELEAAGEFVEPTGRLVVTAPRMFGRLHVLPIVNEFLHQHPGIAVDLRLADGNVDLTAGAADLAVRIGALPDSSLIATRIGKMRSVIAASPSLFERFPMPRDPKDLGRLPMIVFDMPLRSDALRSESAGSTSVAQTRLVVSGAEAAADAAIAGVGFVRLLHYQVADAIDAGSLMLLLEAFERPPAPVHILHAPLAQLPLKIRRFLDAATRELRKTLKRLPRR